MLARCRCHRGSSTEPFSELEVAGALAESVGLLVPTHVVVLRGATATGLRRVDLGAVVAGTGGEAEAGVDDATFGGDGGRLMCSVHEQWTVMSPVPVGRGSRWRSRPSTPRGGMLAR